MARLLCIEDDADIQHAMGQVLFREGYQIDYAWNGREGYEKILSFDPDLILLDLMLPVMSGLELLKKLQDEKRAQDVPIVIVTGFGDEAGLLKKAVELWGAAAYLRKPVLAEDLIRTVKLILERFPRQARPAAMKPLKELCKGCVRLRPESLTVWIDDRLVATLPPKEFALIECLARAPGPVPKEALLKVIGHGTGDMNALKQTIYRLRLAFGPQESRRIKTNSGGYELVGRALPR